MEILKQKNGIYEIPVPSIMQGGMGIYAFPWQAAREVSVQGQGQTIGIPSGTGLQLVVPRLLQLGDQGGHFKRALMAFPDQEMAERVFTRYFVANGIPATKRFKNIEQYTLTPSHDMIELTICANFCQVWLAKNGHDYPIGVNFLEKVQMPHLYALYGALLANVDYVFIGAGIPMQISAVLDKLVRHEPATYAIYVIGADKSAKYQMHFNPRDFIRQTLPVLPRPKFFPIISSSVIAQIMTKSGHQTIDGWIVETNTAGGHSASPRGKAVWTETGEPLYGVRDDLDFEQLKRIGLPFYLAGAFASPAMLAHAKALGAVGIQVASIFALCDQSWIEPNLRTYIRKEAYNGRLTVFNDPNASSTGFPFKVVRIPGTLGDADVYAHRHRICDIGGLLQPYIRDDGKIGYRCSAEPVRGYVKKGGKVEDTENTMCLCNGLHATVGLGQRLKNGMTEPPVVTLGQDLSFLRHLMADENAGYTIRDVIQYLLKTETQKNTL